MPPASVFRNDRTAPGSAKGTLLPAVRLMDGARLIETLQNQFDRRHHLLVGIPLNSSRLIPDESRGQAASEFPSFRFGSCALHETLATERKTFVRDSSAAAGPGECLLGSTEVLESLFGKWKALERHQSQSGITGMILSIGAMLGVSPASRIQAALEATPAKHIVSWCRDNLRIPAVIRGVTKGRDVPPHPDL